VKKILISTGGSGGHVIPAIALFDHYRENFEIYLVSDRRGAKYIDQNKYPFEIIDIPFAMKILANDNCKITTFKIISYIN